MKLSSIALLLLLLLLTGCSTVQSQLHDPAFVAQNWPTRTVHVLVLTDGSYTPSEINRAIAAASDGLFEQVGVVLIPSEPRPIVWTVREMDTMLQDEYKAAIQYEGWDLAMGFTKPGAQEFFVRLLFGANWDGCIDDGARRFIIVKRLDAHTIMHEVAHAFIVSHDHGGGLMSPFTVQVIPFAPPLESNYLTPSDREEFIKHKWKKF